MEKLQWFKFSPMDWVMGKIQRCPEVTQARYLRLICLYWNKEGILSYEDAEIEIDKEHLDILISKKVIKVDNDFISIDFLKEQLKEIKVDKSDKSNSGQIGNLKRWHRDLYDKFVKSELTLDEAVTKSKLSHPDSTPIVTPSQNIAEKTRQDKSREEETRVEKTIVLKPQFCEDSESVKTIYSLYPSTCPIKKSPTGKTSSDRIEIAKVLNDKKYTVDSLSSCINKYVESCTRSKTYIKNFTTFLNNIPDMNEFTPTKTLDDSKYYINKNGIKINRAAAS